MGDMVKGKEKRRVVCFNTITALEALVRAGSDILDDATGSDISKVVAAGPDEIQIVLNSDLDTNDNENAEKTVIRINGLNPKTAIYFSRNGKTDDFSNLLNSTLVESDKGLMAEERNGLATVAGLDNYPIMRKTIENTIGITDLYSEVRPVTKGKLNGNGGVRSVNERQVEVSGEAEIELLGLFKNTQTNLVDSYTQNNNLRNVATYGKGVAQLSVLAVREKIVEGCTPDALCAALAAYYGLINTEDAPKYSSFETMSPDEYAIMIGKMKNPTMRSEDILHYTNWTGVDREDSNLTRYESLALAINNLGVKVTEAFMDSLMIADESSLTGSMFFKDIEENSKYDSLEIAAYFTMGIIKGDESGRANLDESMTMSTAIRNLFFILDSATTLDINNTSYIDAEECITI